MLSRKTTLGKTFMIAVGLVIMLLSLNACAPAAAPEPPPAPEAEKEVIKVAVFSWDSSQVATALAAFILKHGYGYETETTPGETMALWQGLRAGDLHLQLEVYPESQFKTYNEAMQEGSVTRLGYSYELGEGWYVPFYVIEGDPARGIEPMAPDLKTIEDLPQYRELFPDPEDPEKGLLYSGVPGWEAERASIIKVETYGLDAYYNTLSPGSEMALTATMAAAYEKGEPWLGYYWVPSWPLAKYKMTKIIEPVPYDKDLWEADRSCDWPVQLTETACNTEWLKTADPEVIVFLCKFHVTKELVSQFLLYMHEEEADANETAIWIMKELEDVWTEWVSVAAANKVKAALP